MQGIDHQVNVHVAHGTGKKAWQRAVKVQHGTVLAFQHEATLLFECEHGYSAMLVMWSSALTIKTFLFSVRSLHRMHNRTAWWEKSCLGGN
mmetsp:Transcript_18046/g.45313  ORF Transcript_18046/g.45313 Transcript_18046/m.45313 type:complete len:91 (-) Transcript_18046:94-366(-)